MGATPAGTIKIDPLTLATDAPGVFSGGDAAFPPGMLITAAQQGKLAARSIDAYLRGVPPGTPHLHVKIEELPTDTYSMLPKYEQIRREIPIVELGRRTGITEVESRLSIEQAREQASRCLYCHVHPIYNSSACILCNRCVDVCPEHCLHFRRRGRCRRPGRSSRVSRPRRGKHVSVRRSQMHPLRALRGAMPDLSDNDGTLRVRGDG